MKDFIANNWANAKLLNSWDTDPKSPFFGTVFKSKKDKNVTFTFICFCSAPKYLVLLYCCLDGQLKNNNISKTFWKPASFYITPCQFCPRLKLLLVVCPS